MREANEDNTAWRRALRREMVARRAALSDAEHDALSARIVEQVLVALPTPRVFAFCWPIKHEPDVRAVVERWAVLGVQAALPVVVAEDPLTCVARGGGKALEMIDVHGGDVFSYD